MTNSVAMVAEGLHKLALQHSQEALENGALRPLSTDIETWAGTSNGGFEIRHLVGAPPPAPPPPRAVWLSRSCGHERHLGLGVCCS